MAFMENAFPKARRWTLGTPLWNLRTQHFYEQVGYVKIGERDMTESVTRNAWLPIINKIAAG
jgi:hypothetical protein